jgi:hypothetical protein
MAMEKAKNSLKPKIFYSITMLVFDQKTAYFVFKPSITIFGNILDDNF